MNSVRAESDNSETRRASSILSLVTSANGAPLASDLPRASSNDLALAIDSSAESSAMVNAVSIPDTSAG